ncbi:2363_t:CDS:2, partial [Paraglomus occultum]
MSHTDARRRQLATPQRHAAVIKDGFEELRRQVPFAYSNNGRRMSKATLLQKTAHHVKKLRSRENFLLEEINRLNRTVLCLSAQLENER